MLEGLTFDDVTLVPGYTSRSSRVEVDTTTRLGPFTFKIPLVSANMDSLTGVLMARRMYELGGLGILHRFCSIEDNVSMFREASKDGYLVGVSVGVNGDELARLEALTEAGAKIICLDVAHAHSKLAAIAIKEARDLWPDVYIIAGNVCTDAGADSLAGWGADCIKVGVGPGAACTTRMQTGYGVPQLTAIMDCQRTKVPIIGDGGIRKGADFVKALAAGATMVMVGSLFAGTDETPGETHDENLGPPSFLYQKMKTYRGMASREAQEEFIGHMPDWKTAEGVSFDVPVKGPVEDVVKILMGGLRSGMTYCGANNLEELRRKAKFMRITQAGYIEGTAHGAKS